jgi:hypothetical protein
LGPGPKFRLFDTERETWAKRLSAAETERDALAEDLDKAETHNDALTEVTSA